MHVSFTVPKRVAIAFAGLILSAGAGYLLYTYPPIGAVSHSAPEDAERISSLCAQEKDSQAGHEKCVAHELALLAKKQGHGYMGDVLTAYQMAGRAEGYGGYQNYNDCHVLSHRISNELASESAGDWLGLLERMSDEGLDLTRCGGGFLHGVLEVRQGEDPTFTINADVYRELCGETLPLETSSSCEHILGHLLLVQEDGKLDEALKGCDGLTGSVLFQCAGGIFMEDSMRTNLAAHGLGEEPVRNEEWFARQVARCKSYGGEGGIVDGCWYDLPEVYASSHNYDLAGTYAFCKTAPNPVARDQCLIRGSYLIAIMPNELFDPAFTKDLCAVYAAGTPELTACMQSVVGASLSNSLFGFFDRTLSFCSERPEAAKSACFRMMGPYVGRARIPAPEQAALCEKLPAEDRVSCSNVAAAYGASTFQ